MKKIPLIFILLLSLSYSVYGQAPNQQYVDSLQKVLPGLPDTTKVIALLKLCREKMFVSGDEAVRDAYRAISISREIGYQDGLGLSYSLLGGYHLLVKNDFNTARAYLDSANVPDQSSRTLRVVYYINSMWYSQHGDLDKSHTYLSDALRISGPIQDDTTAMICDVLGYNLNKIGRKKEAVQYYKRSIRIYERKESDKSALSKLAATLNNLATVLMERDMPDSAFLLFKRIYAIEQRVGNPKDNPSLLGNLGKIYLAQGKDDSAYYFMHTALRAPSINQTPYAIQLCTSNLAIFHLSHNVDSALYYAHLVLDMVKDQSPLSLEEVYGVLAKAYEKKRRFDSAYYYQKKYLQYHDSVFTEKRTQQIAELETMFSLERKEKEISRLQESQKNEIFRRNALAVGLVLTLIITLLSLYSFRSKMKARKKEIEFKNAQLEDYIRALVEKSELIEELRSETEHLKTEASGNDQERVESLTHILNSSILTENDWERFKSLFEQVHPNFFAELKLKFPSLSAAEIRLCALLKLNLATKEIANMLGISIDSVTKARYRLRKKLELHPEEELGEVIGKV